MTTPIKEITEAIINNPKTGLLVVAASEIERFWVDWGSPTIDAIARIAGLVLVLVLIRNHLATYKKNKQDKDK